MVIGIAEKARPCQNRNSIGASRRRLPRQPLPHHLEEVRNIHSAFAEKNAVALKGRVYEPRIRMHNHGSGRP